MKSGQRQAAPQVRELTIERLGSRGDGVGALDGMPVYVPFALPGEAISVTIEGKRGEGLGGRLDHIVTPASDRVEPRCRHFGVCGGCSLQHLALPAYRRWKTNLLGESLARRGVVAGHIAPILGVGAGARRRASFTAIRTRRGAIFGFNARASHFVTDLSECPVLDPRLVAHIELWRRFVESHMPVGAQAQFVANILDTGIDLLVRADGELDLARREALAELARSPDIARVSWSDGARTEPVAAVRDPILQIGDIAMIPPPGAFLQATVTGEQAMRTAINSWVGPAKSVVDFYAGIGTLSLQLLPDRQVHCVEGDRAAVDALERASRLPAARRRLTAACRDLARDPVTADELAAYDCAIFDPPRIGAAELARALAQSRIGTIIAGSCDPGSFARDAGILTDGGYRLVEVRPIDQFQWSAHVELIAVFKRDD